MIIYFPLVHSGTSPVLPRHCPPETAQPAAGPVLSEREVMAALLVRHAPQDLLLGCSDQQPPIPPADHCCLTRCHITT